TGIGAKTAEKLIKAGFANFRELARTKPETVAKGAGISLRLARVAVEGSANAA
ncbi:MAG: hypothetical protein GWN58_15700, partial [Anaerolineae bacterium]|nr:hypothetical protein [Anaerolineae bacterium]